MQYVDSIVEGIWPTYYESIVQPQATSMQQNGRKIIPSRVSIVFCASTGIYIPQKENGGRDCSGFVVMPDVQEEAYSPLPLSEWSWSLPDEYDVLIDVWRNQIQPALLPRLIQEQSHNYRTDSGQGGYSMSAGGAALGFLADALEATGGRGVFWTWRRPNHGVGALVDRERWTDTSGKNQPPLGVGMSPSLYMPLQDSLKNPIVEKYPPLKTAADFYSNLGKKCAASKVALDIVIHSDPQVPQSFFDIATLGRLCEASSGRLVWINKLSYDASDGWRQAVMEEVMRPVYLGGWDVIFKVRCSQGLSVRSVMSSVGNLSTTSSLTDQDDELELSVVTPETVIGVTLEHRVGGLPKQSEFAYVQTALLYTNPWTGDRRVRVSTLALKVSSQPQQILPSMDFGALAALQLRQSLPHGNYPSTSSISLETASSSSGGDVASPDQRGDRVLTQARKDLVDACVQVLAAHRQEISKRRPPSMAEFLVPESLQLYPLFVLSALKSPLLRPSLPRRGTGTQTMIPTPRGDERAYYFYCARKISPAAALLLVNPLLFDLGSSFRAQSTEEDHHGTFEWKHLRQFNPSNSDVMANLKTSPVVDLPNPMDATVSNLAEDGIYLLDTCFAAYILIERDAVESYEQVESKVRNAVTQLQLWSQVGKEPKCLRPMASLPIVQINQRSDTEKYQSLLRWMVLDATSHEKDFAQFCSDLNRKIQKIAGM
jgi:hypothetical protein